MTFSNFKYALDGSSPSDLASVMTEKELLLKEEGETATVASSGNGMSVVPFKFKPDLDEAMKAFAMGERKAVEISVHGKTEVCQLGALAGDSTLDQLTANFPKKPRFFCLNYGRKVFVFFCPDDAKVRTKMLLATCKSAVTGQAISKHGIEFDKQVEILGADELAAAFAEEAAPSDEAAKTNFTKAKRKTRGKRRLNTKKKFAWT